MLQSEIKNSFVELGRFLSQFKNDNYIKNENVMNNSIFFDEFENLIENSIHHNNWFTKENVLFSINNWANALTESNLNHWLSLYNFDNVTKKTIGIILAGNIPLVGFHDFLSVLISGHKVKVKLSSNDQQLIQFIAKYLIQLNTYFIDNIEFVEGKLENFDAVIATGSNNTARYFDYYFGKYPNIIRKNRNSVAVLTGNETVEQLTALGDDIFKYFGLGCRNVSKLFVPNNYNFDAFFKGMFAHKDIIDYEKYASNYDYNKAVYLMSLFQILDNGFLTIKEDQGYASPISSVFYEYYNSIEEIQEKLKSDYEQIQCIVSNGCIENSVNFGETQKPQLWDYADHVDTLKFLIEL